MYEIILDQERHLSDAMDRMNVAGRNFCVVTDENRVAGVITDGDIRRYLISGGEISDSLNRAMNREFVSLPAESEPEEIQVLLRNLTFVPILERNGGLLYVATRNRPHKIPLAEPFIGEDEERRLLECFRSGWISSRSPLVGEFEEQFSSFIGVDQGLCVSNGTVAIELALRALGISAGDEVLVPDLTFGATANAVLNVGAIPRFVDISPKDWGIDPSQLRAQINEQTRAVILVHLYGAPAQLYEIRRICDENGLVLVEDCAEAIGSFIGDTHVGSVGDAATFSFFANKTITTGEGGYVTFREEGALELARQIRDHGLSSTSSEHYWHSTQGSNMRLTGLQASIGIAQMERVREIVETKRGIALMYRDALQDLPDVEVRPEIHGLTNAHWLTVVTLKGILVSRRSELRASLVSAGIECRLGFQPLHLMPAFESYYGGDFPLEHSIDVSQRIFCLPSGARVGSAQVSATVGAIRDFVQESG